MNTASCCDKAARPGGSRSPGADALLTTLRDGVQTAAMTDQTKIALITGASRGLGAALAEALAPEYHIVAVARTTGGLEELDDRIKAKGGSATLAPDGHH